MLAYVRNQWNCISKEDTILSTVSNEGLMIPFMVDAMEFRDVATSEIPRDFLQTYYKKGDIPIKMEG